MEYRPRIYDQLLRDQLDAMGAVLVEGPKASGKTTTAAQMAGSVLYMSDPRSLQRNLQMVELGSEPLLAGAVPRLIDEWQVAPKLWDAVRFAVDQRRDVGQFILTGSAVPASTRDIIHTGTGRFGWLTMRPMSLWESGDSTGSVSLGALFSGQPPSGSVTIDIDRLAYLVCRGGWPMTLTARSRNAALTQPQMYFKAVVEADTSRVDGTRRDPERMARLMRSLARHQGSPASIPSIRKDIAANDLDTLSDPTVADYISALRRIFVVEDMPAWNPNLRSRAAIRSADTRYFVDPSVAAAALGVGPGDLVADLNTLGLLFETLCVRDLRVYADALHGAVSHFRDSNGLECDSVVHLPNGHYGLVEVKLGGDRLIDEGARTLLKLASLVDTERMPPPSFLMVLVGVGDLAYLRPDGVAVVPIGALRD